MRLWTINGVEVAHVDSKAHINAVAMSSYPVGVFPNVVALGGDDVCLGRGEELGLLTPHLLISSPPPSPPPKGTIAVHGLLDLEALMVLRDPRISAPVMALAFSAKSNVVSGHDDGRIVCWGRPLV